jgi:hypothetical protein
MWYMVASAVLTVAGTVIQSNAQKAAASRTRSAIAKQEEGQNPFRQKASSLITTTADQFDPNLRMQRRKGRDVENLKEYFGLREKNEPFREADVFTGGNITETERYSAGADEAREARDIRNLTSAAQFFSPYQASNIDETRLVNNLSNKMNLNRNFAAGEFNVDQQAIERAKQVNQSAMMWGSILQGLGLVVGMGGAASAASAAGKTAATEAAKTAAINSASQSAIGTTAGRFGLQTAAQAAPIAASTAPTWASAAGSVTGTGAGNAFSMGLSAAELQKLRLAGTPGVGSTARQMFAPIGAANAGVQDYSYQLWNLPR